MHPQRPLMTSGSATTSLVFVANKMNACTSSSHTSTSYNNVSMPNMVLMAFTSSGGYLGTISLSPSSVQLLRFAYNSQIRINCILNNPGTTSTLCAIAWY